MKRLSAILMLLLLLGANMSFSQQNLVFNPSFEQYNQCPARIDALGVMNDVEAWWQPTGGSSDYFHPCGGRDCRTPRNKLGTQEPHEGLAYCGIYCSQNNYREYLQTQLKESLQEGATYHVVFYVSLAEKSPEAIATIGALFTRDRISDTTRSIFMNKEVVAQQEGSSQTISTFFSPQIVNTIESPINDTRSWTRVEGRFKAEGGEMFLTIGNFFSTNKSGLMLLNNGNSVLNGAYYYIDDVSVMCEDCGKAKPKPEPSAPPLGDTMVLENVFFAFDDSQLLQQSFVSLSALVKLLNDNPNLDIELRGHTDGMGSIDHNQSLSERRAKAVGEYLIAHGIESRRITAVGFGKSRPIADNSTEQGRAKNRRVEYVLIKR